MSTSTKSTSRWLDERSSKCQLLAAFGPWSAVHDLRSRLSNSFLSMGKLLTFGIVVGALFASASFSGDYIGASSSCINDQCVVGGSSSPGSVIVSLLIVAFLFLRPNLPTVVNKSGVVGVWRRLGAFLVDFVLVILVISPIAALPLLVAEASYTGTFEWSFVRKFARPSDSYLVLPGVFASIAALYFYFYIHPLKGKQTPGEYILCFKVIAATDVGLKPAYGTRPITSFIGLCAWPISVYFALRQADKRFWWDTHSRTRAVMVSPSPGN